MNTEPSNIVRLADRRSAIARSPTIASAIALHEMLAEEFAALLLKSYALRDVAHDDVRAIATELADVALPVRD